MPAGLQLPAVLCGEGERHWETGVDAPVRTGPGGRLKSQLQRVAGGGRHGGIGDRGGWSVMAAP